MATGSVKRLVHLSQQCNLANARLIPDHSDRGHGILEDEHRREVYFACEAVEGRDGFRDLRRGQQVEFTLESAPYLRADAVWPATPPPLSAAATKDVPIGRKGAPGG